jgi:hypothetical protein
MTNIPSTTLRPGLLVCLKTSISNTVTYDRIDLEPISPVEEEPSKHVARWETVRTIGNLAEHEKSIKVRSKARALISSVCAKSAFGLLCPEAASPDLDKAMSAARKLCEDFNNEAELTRVHIYIICGRVAADDVEATKAINSEVRDLLSDMESGFQKLDVAMIRDSAKRLKDIGPMLAPIAQGRTMVVVDAVRAVATKMKAAGDKAIDEIDAQTIAVLREARTAFLDFDDAGVIAQPAEQSRSVDVALDM